MSKKDNSQIESGFDMEETSEADKLEAFKASKREAAKRFKERKAEQKAAQIEKANAFIARAKSEGLWDKFTDDEKALLTGLANPASSNFGGTESVFSKLFGANPVVGTSITLNDAFNKTLKGKSNIDALVKKWAEKGTIVSFQKADNVLDSTYTLEAIGQ